MDTEQDIYKPDIDNIAKLILDALNGIAYEDDAQVVILQCAKKPRTRAIEDTTQVTVSF